MTQFNSGDKVVTKGGDKLVVVTHNAGSPAALCETPEGVTPYARSWYPVEDLKVQRTRNSKAAKKAFRIVYVPADARDDERVESSIEAADDMAALALLGDQVNVGEVVSIDQVDA